LADKWRKNEVDFAPEEICIRKKITNCEYRQLAGLSDEGARIDLNDLIKRKIFEKVGKGRSVYYVLKSGD